MPHRSCSAIDRIVGLNIRAQRTACGWTQAKLGAKVGLTFQMIQKYELGKCRVAAGRLFEISRVLNVPVEYFFYPPVP